MSQTASMLLALSALEMHVLADTDLWYEYGQVGAMFQFFPLEKEFWWEKEEKQPCLVVTTVSGYSGECEVKVSPARHNIFSVRHTTGQSDLANLTWHPGQNNRGWNTLTVIIEKYHLIFSGILENITFDKSMQRCNDLMLQLIVRRED